MKRVVHTRSHSLSYEDPLFDALRPQNPSHAVPLKYPQRFAFYDQYPIHEIRLEHLERLAISRLKLLRAVENHNARLQHGAHGTSDLVGVHEKWMPLHSNSAFKGYNLDEERLNDITSHFILRLAFCSKEETRRWLITQEVALFRWRFQNLITADERAAFIQTTFPQLEFISGDELDSVASLLQNMHVDGDAHFYKVPWEHVPDLVSRRIVLLNKGWAYVYRSEVLSIISTAFRNLLEKELAHAASVLPFFDTDDRILYLLQAISTGDDNIDGTVGQITAKMEKLAASDVDKVCYFAPLFISLFTGNSLTFCHHVFLMIGCNAFSTLHDADTSSSERGWPLEAWRAYAVWSFSQDDAIVYWKKAFSKKITEDGFQKNYLYNIRHNYGQEGKRTNYPPFSCHRIITNPGPSVGDAHGCPFRHQNPDSLAAWLSTTYGSNVLHQNSKSLSSAEINDIMSITTSGHYQLSCTRLLETLRGTNLKLDAASGGVITYPHQFYEQSISCCKQ